MKIQIIILTLCFLTSYSINGQHSDNLNQEQSKHCKKGTKQAENDHNDGHLKHIYIENPYIFSEWTGRVPRYRRELSELLENYKIEYSIQYFQKNKKFEYLSCYKQYMDSVITSKYEVEFFKDIELEADSLFASKYKEKTYNWFDLDVRPEILKVKFDSTLISLSPITIYLTGQHKDTSEYKFVHTSNSDISFDIEFNVDSVGNASNCVITRKSNNINLDQAKLEELENNLIQLINESKNWFPGEINNRKVNSTNIEFVGVDFKIKTADNKNYKQ